MQNKALIDLYGRLQKVNHFYQQMMFENEQIKIIVHSEFVIDIKNNQFFDLYLNNIFYYNIDEQDIYDMIVDLLSGEYVFCLIETRKRTQIKVVQKDMFQDSHKILKAWTVEGVLKV